MTKRRRLEDLYVRGRELSIDDGSGDPVVVWLQKLSPLEHEKAIRAAGAARARVLMAGREPQNEQWQEAYADLADLGERDALVSYLLSDEMVKLQETKEAELAFKDEWAKDGYLQGLRDAWEAEEDPLKERYAKDKEDEEARRVFLELKRFSDQVSAEVEPELERLRRDYDEIPMEELEQRAVKRLLELRASLAWLREYKHSEVYYAVRDPEDHRKYYFSKRSEVDEIASEVFKEISDAYQELTVEPSEGKDSHRTPNSSPSSEPLSAVAT